MSAIISEHKCITCKHFDRGNNECAERVVFLDGLNEYEFISECIYWEAKENE